MNIASIMVCEKIQIESNVYESNYMKCKKQARLIHGVSNSNSACLWGAASSDPKEARTELLGVLSVFVT